MAEAISYLNEEDFQAWLRQHSMGRPGDRGREPYYETQNVQTGEDAAGDPTYGSRRTQVGEKITANDGSVIIIRRTPESGQPGKPDYAVFGYENPKPPEDNRTPAQTRGDEALATAQEQKNQQAQREANEIDYNSRTPDEFGEAVPETRAQRAERVQKKRDAIKAREVQQQNIAASQASTEATRARITQDAAQNIETGRHNVASEGLTREQIDLQRQTANKPTFLSQADDKTQNITSYNPQTGQIESVANPNYDAVKAAAAEKRAELASQIASRQINLEEAKQTYTQWFDTNVKTPLMLAQEMRARAEERRQALDAEERRRQFAASYALQKTTLGQKAGQDAAQNEISLLPYRSGPTWGADISSAINSLAAGGKVGGPDAGAGIHFSDSSFAFDRPDFKAIAAAATKAAIGHLTDYKPSSQQYETGDYSGVPQVNLSGMPNYVPPATPEPVG